MDNLLGLGGFGLFVTWMSCAILGGMIGHRKGAAVAGMLFGIALGPIGVAFAMAMAGGRGECLYCMELVRYQAKKCPHCHSELTVKPAVQFVTKDGKAV